MLNKLFKITDRYKRQPHSVQKFTMRQQGSKFYIEAHFDDTSSRVIGKYSNREEAHAAMESLSELTKSDIIK